MDTALEPGCGEYAHAEATFYGGIETRIGWTAETMACDSMPRPNGEGIRLRMMGDVAGEQLAVIVALPTLQPGSSGEEVPSNVTVTVEGTGRFFSTPNLSSCWTEVSAQSPLTDDATDYVLEGTLFCIAPLGEVNGDATLSIPELRFATLLNWNR